MIFLKKFEAKGFKSYADHIRLNFDTSLIGIVGPNGAGKSNVIDAIKWVLGEKSIKALRGKKSDDIIFHGSKSKEKSEFAEVTLTFDNANKVLHIDKDTVAVTRRLYRGSGNTEYFINGEPTRLKDIMDIFTDTGLSKGSLGIISQGTVNWFADSKPEDRRTIFEEAAGIGRYTRKKEESLRQLERTQTNLNRLVDICKELQRDIKKLETQASKVKEYKAKKDELTELELHILTKDALTAQTKLKEVNHILDNANTHKDEITPKISQYDEELLKSKDLLSQSENRIEKFNWELSEVKDNINKLEIQKAIYDTDIKEDINSKDYETKLKALTLTIKTLDAELNSKKEFLEFNKKELINFDEQINNLINHEKMLQKDLIELIKKNVEDVTNLRYLNEYIASRPNQEAGSKTVIDNQKALTGILGTVLEHVKCEEQYENPLVLALGRNVNNIIVNTNRDAKRCIDFLVENKAGTCTFMPIYELKPKPIKQEHLEIMMQLPGFIDVASNLVKVEKKIKPVFEILLGRVIIAKDFDSAMEISKYTYQLYKIITLDGQIVNPQGSITGGYAKANDTVLINIESRKKTLIKIIEDNKKNQEKLEKQRSDVDREMIGLRNKIAERKTNESKSLDAINSLEKESILLKSEYEKFSKTKYEDSTSKPGEKINSKSVYESIVSKLNSLGVLKERIESDLNHYEQNRKELKNRIIQLEDALTDMRKGRDEDLELILQYQQQQSNYNHSLNAIKDKLNEVYKMTLEHAIEKYSEPLKVSDSVARQKIDKLSKEISYMGNINMEAIDELEEKTERYEKLKAEEEEISQAKDTILETIKELDTKAHADFEITVRKINEELPKTFSYLFGGGTCKIEFTDSQDILTSGIEIVASPPGKHVNSLFALSGGEKTLVALSVLFSILKISSFPLVILDEAESALDPSNVERFGNIISEYSKNTQFLVITHRPGTMERCVKLYGATMPTEGVTSMYAVQLKDAQENFGFESEGN